MAENYDYEDEEDNGEDYDGARSGKIPRVSPIYILKGITLSAVVTGYILGPLLVLGGFGLWIQKHFETSRAVLFAFIIVAMLTSNTLIFIRAKKDIQTFAKKTKNADKENKN